MKGQRVSERVASQSKRWMRRQLGSRAQPTTLQEKVVPILLNRIKLKIHLSGNNNCYITAFSTISKHLFNLKIIKESAPFRILRANKFEFFGGKLSYVAYYYSARNKIDSKKRKKVCAKGGGWEFLADK